jgi:small subunit ribosomal protein S4e
LEDNKIVDHAKLELSYLAYITAGNNVGRVGTITARDRHYGGFDIVHLKDANGKSFATRIGNVFVIGKNKKPWISLPKEKGLYLSALEKKAQNEGPV